MGRAHARTQKLEPSQNCSLRQAEPSHVPSLTSRFLSTLKFCVTTRLMKDFRKVKSTAAWAGKGPNESRTGGGDAISSVLGQNR